MIGYKASSALSGRDSAYAQYAVTLPFAHLIPSNQYGANVIMKFNENIKISKTACNEAFASSQAIYFSFLII